VRGHENWCRAADPVQEEMFRRDFADDDITVFSIEYRDLMIRSDKNDKIQMPVRQQYLWVFVGPLLVLIS
jgi:hypothetical protein